VKSTTIPLLAQLFEEQKVENLQAAKTVFVQCFGKSTDSAVQCGRGGSERG
jgi:hypothetical protein